MLLCQRGNATSVHTEVVIIPTAHCSRSKLEETASVYVYLCPDETPSAGNNTSDATDVTNTQECHMIIFILCLLKADNLIQKRTCGFYPYF